MAKLNISKTGSMKTKKYFSKRKKRLNLQPQLTWCLSSVGRAMD
ncbi:uncharacterized protein METZ01_LOCUS314436 [marine metagenome]|uniref:Uncharacterized protein n=1 Tax=marine metagenome TaxID=408172 RepID=A0A382NPB7_9ZZZZ